MVLGFRVCCVRSGDIQGTYQPHKVIARYSDAVFGFGKG